MRSDAGTILFIFKKSKQSMISLIRGGRVPLVEGSTRHVARQARRRRPVSHRIPIAPPTADVPRFKQSGPRMEQVVAPHDIPLLFPIGALDKATRSSQVT